MTDNDNTDKSPVKSWRSRRKTEKDSKNSGGGFHDNRDRSNGGGFRDNRDNQERSNGGGFRDNRDNRDRSNGGGFRDNRDRSNGGGFRDNQERSNGGGFRDNQERSNGGGFRDNRDRSNGGGFRDNRDRSNGGGFRDNRDRSNGGGFRDNRKKDKTTRVEVESVNKRGWSQVKLDFGSSNSVNVKPRKAYKQSDARQITFEEYSKMKQRGVSVGGEYKITTGSSSRKQDAVVESFCGKEHYLERCIMMYGAANDDPVVNTTLEIKKENANCTGPQERIIHLTALEECGGQMLDVCSTPNIDEVDESFGNNGVSVKTSNSAKKIIMENSLKSLTNTIVPEIKSKVKNLNFLENPQMVGKQILDLSNHSRLCNLIRDKVQLLAFQLRIQLHLYTEYMKHLLKDDNTSLLTEVFINALITNNRFEDLGLSEEPSNKKSSKKKAKKKGESAGLRWDLLYPLDLPRFMNYMKKTAKALKGVNLHQEQFCNFSHRIEPQNPFQNRTKTLDGWQIELLRMMHSLEPGGTVVVTAPTGTGKTAVSCSYILNTSGRMIYISPNDTLARQQCGDFRKSGYSAILLLEDEVFWEDQPDIIVGTPSMISKYFSLRHCEPGKFDWIVVDEVHQIKQNKDDNDQSVEARSLQILLKQFLGTTKFLLLSATIPEPENLRKWAETVSGKEARLCSYNRRFTALRHYRFNGKAHLGKRLEKFSVLAGADIEFVQSGGLMQSSFNLPPEELWTCASSPHLEQLIKSPTEFFGEDKLAISLFDIQDYEVYFKKMLTELANDVDNQSAVETFLNAFSVNEEPTQVSLFNVLKTMQARRAYPAILFYENTTECELMFEQLLDFLEAEEQRIYPERQDLLRYLAEKCNDSMEEVEKRVEKLTVPQKEKKRAATFIATKQRQMEQAELTSLKAAFRTKAERVSARLETKYGLTGSELEQSKKYYKELCASVDEWETMNRPDEYSVMPDFSFFVGSSQISDDQKRSFRRMIDKIQKKNANCGGKQKKSERYGYTSLTMRGIERGVVLYTKNTTAAEQQAIQRLFNQKQIQFLVSDHQMAQGVNTPAKTVVLMGHESKQGHADKVREMSVLKASQMIGRAGRRGYHDKGGVVVHVSVNTKGILRSTYESIAEDNILDGTTHLPGLFSKHLTKDVVERNLKLPMIGHLDEDKKEYKNQYNAMDMSVLHLAHKSVAHLIWSMRRFRDDAYLSPVIADFLLRRFKSSSDLTTVTGVFQIFSIFDPDWKEADTALKLGSLQKQLTDFANIVKELGYPCRLNTDLADMYRRNRVDELDVVDKSRILERLITIARAMSTFHNWHRDRSTSKRSSGYCKQVSDVVMPSFKHLMTLIGKFS
jgi:hypothetical protein